MMAAARQWQTARPLTTTMLAAILYFWMACMAIAAEIVVRIDLSDQQMTVHQNAVLLHVWPVSTGIGRFKTPTGTFRPIRLERMWYSTKYDNAPMPYAIFFHRGYAIHGTTEIARLGQAASHGCVRLTPENAKTLFDLVRFLPRSQTEIRITR